MAKKKAEMKDLLFGTFYPQIAKLMTEDDIFVLDQRLTDLYSKYDIENGRLIERDADTKTYLHTLFCAYYEGINGKGFFFSKATERDKWEYLEWVKRFIYHYAEISL